MTKTCTFVAVVSNTAVYNPLLFVCSSVVSRIQRAPRRMYPRFIICVQHEEHSSGPYFIGLGFRVWSLGCVLLRSATALDSTASDSPAV
jgi:hypothetical protein